MRNRYHSLWLALSGVALICLLLPPGPVLAQGPGELDPGFNGGKVTTNFNSGTDCCSAEEAHALALQSDGKIVTAGNSRHFYGSEDFALARYLVDGSLDTTFGGDGKVTTNFSSGLFSDSYDIAYALALQPDGKIMVVGLSDKGFGHDFALARYLADGNLDTTFGGDGKVTTDFSGSQDSAQAAALQPDGRIVVAGRNYNGSTTDLVLARYLADGSLDSTFDSDGKMTTDFRTTLSSAYILALQPDGKIVVAGFSDGLSYDFALARYLVDGSLDPTFGDNGKVITDFSGSQDSAQAVALQPDGKIIVMGYSGDDFALARYQINGSLDPAFGDNGKVTTDFSGWNSFAYALALHPDGKIVVTGVSSYGSTYHDFALARYQTNGSLDSTFGTNGKLTIDFSGSDDFAQAVALQPDGKIVVAGSSNSDFALIRYMDIVRRVYLPLLNR